MLLKDRIAIITGGSSGIGRGIALECAREGARVAVVDIQETPLRGKYHETDTTTPTVAEIEKLGADGLFLEADVADESQVARIIQRTVEHFGGLDILVNNAGYSYPGWRAGTLNRGLGQRRWRQSPWSVCRDETRTPSPETIEIW